MPANVKNERVKTMETFEVAALLEQAGKLAGLIAHLQAVDNLEKRLQLLLDWPETAAFLNENTLFRSVLPRFSLGQQAALLAVAAIGEGKIVFNKLNHSEEALAKLRSIAEQLQEIEAFYHAIGGVIGYHKEMLLLIAAQLKGESSTSGCRFIKPHGFHLFQENDEVRESLLRGIKELGELCEIYPVGGAGDRLNLKEGQEALPAACLQFTGRTLLELLLRDLQGREYLHYKLFGKQVATPIAMMTSHEKNNHRHIQTICEQKQWFGRGREAFFFFIQPLAPVITKEGHWSLKEPLKLTLKPTGHGVLWKLAADSGAFDWLEKQGRKKAVVRQINNPLAGTDTTLLAFAGYGQRYDKAFGFASCPRFLNASEGMDVLCEKMLSESLYEYSLTNVEYTEFVKYGIKDEPEEPGSQYSAFPCNTNILFADLQAMRKAVQQCVIPGMLCNLKSKANFIDEEGKAREVPAGRLESTMQNIADYIVDSRDHRIQEQEQEALSSYLTFNERRKTISVTKKSYVPGEDPTDTPEWCFWDLLANQQELLSRYCGMQIPENRKFEEYLAKGPAFIFLYHPALGPLYSIIGQKIKRGKIEQGSEWQLEIAEFACENLHLEGSLLITASEVMGEKGINQKLHYSNSAGKCELYNVHVQNEGIDCEAKNIYWKNQIVRKECLRIEIQGNGEFYAKDVSFRGNIAITVPAGQRMAASMKDGRVVYTMSAIDKPTWHWQYELKENNKIEIRPCQQPADKL